VTNDKEKDFLIPRGRGINKKKKLPRNMKEDAGTGN